MIDKIKKYFWKTEGMDYNNPSSTMMAKFHLVYGKMLIGILTYDDGYWSFNYSDEFINNNTLKPIIDFPDLTKTYISTELWPFFLTRIPSINQPYQFKKIEKAKANKHDSVALLKIFGNETITNPYKLFAI